VGTEHISDVAAQMNEGDISDQQSSAIRDRYNWETPLLTGRVMAAALPATQWPSRLWRLIPTL